jgi:hypothetical protein
MCAGVLGFFWQVGTKRLKNAGWSGKKFYQAALQVPS